MTMVCNDRKQRCEADNDREQRCEADNRALLFLIIQLIVYGGYMHVVTDTAV